MFRRCQLVVAVAVESVAVLVVMAAAAAWSSRPKAARPWLVRVVAGFPAAYGPTALNNFYHCAVVIKYLNHSAMTVEYFYHGAVA